MMEAVKGGRFIHCLLAVSQRGEGGELSLCLKVTGGQGEKEQSEGGGDEDKRDGGREKR